MNVVVLVGSVARPPERRELGNGQVVLSFDVSVPGAERGTESVPVAWTEPDPKVPVDEGLEVVVVGRVRRRFFRAGGATQSRTEVVATRVVPARQKARARAVVAQAASALSEAS